MSICVTESPSSRAAQEAIWKATDLAQQIRNMAADDIARVRGHIDRIKSIRDSDFTPDVLAHFCAVVSEKVKNSSWSHTEAAGVAQACLDDLSDDLKFLTKEKV